jgi:hypothetical protein
VTCVMYSRVGTSGPCGQAWAGVRVFAGRGCSGGRRD